METYEQAASNISGDLHDDVGQQLTVINLQLEHLKYDSPDLEIALNPVSESLSTLSQSIRSISHSLNNQLVVQQDLLKGIAAEVERLKQRTGISVSFAFEPKARKEFTTNEKIIIYRIFQECINNSFKHAKASSIKVAITVTPRFEMTITDNGVGFDTLKNTKKASLGLLSMNSRAAAIGYTLTIASTPNKGTTITLSEDITN
ncbi:sensor histidine kinase [Flavobacterium sp. 25HG05S-40]|uniref:sensor histidine kinase n=1 Tax=Flavobacterium sp. 25HG05S-40 TaxID=3458682 RepID=UPI0040443E95